MIASCTGSCDQSAGCRGWLVSRSYPTRRGFLDGADFASGRLRWRGCRRDGREEASSDVSGGARQTGAELREGACGAGSESEGCEEGDQKESGEEGEAGRQEALRARGFAGYELAAARMLVAVQALARQGSPSIASQAARVPACPAPAVVRVPGRAVGVIQRLGTGWSSSYQMNTATCPAW
jgi:hypothetical protein